MVGNNIDGGGDPDGDDPHRVVNHEAALKSSNGFPQGCFLCPLDDSGLRGNVAHEERE